MKDKKPTQLEKFKEAAREAETDDSEEAFDRTLGRIAKAQPPQDAAPKSRGGKAG